MAGLVVIVAASALLLQPFGYNQGSHLALVKALAHGTPRIDAYRDYTGDESYFHGHFYSNKAPGLAFFSLPAYELLGAVHLPRGVHVLSLWGALLPAALLLLLVRFIAERVEPGLGSAAAATLGVGTLILPFSGMFFAHLLSSLLAFAAFAMLWREREGPPRLRLVAAAGLLAGLAITTEYQLALVAAVLAAYAIARADLVRRTSAFLAGAVLGLVPLAAYNWWAFGSIAHLSYADLTAEHGTAAERASSVQHPQLFGLSLPSPHVAVELLLSWRGLLILAPVIVAAAAGIRFLDGLGRRAEALAIGATALSLLVFNASFWGPFGGWGPGPRYLMSMLPLLGVPLALAWRRFPVTTGALAAASAAMLLLATVEMPVFFLHGDTATIGTLLHELGRGHVTETVVGPGWLAIAPFAIALVVGLVLVAAATPRIGIGRRDVESAAVGLAGWLVVTLAAPSLLDRDRLDGGSLGAAAAALLAALVLVAVVRVFRRGLAAALPALPLAALAVPAVHRHAVWAVFVVLGSGAAIAAVERSALRAGVVRGARMLQRPWPGARTTEL
jgi:hypothetical protein